MSLISGERKNVLPSNGSVADNTVSNEDFVGPNSTSEPFQFVGKSIPHSSSEQYGSNIKQARTSQASNTNNELTVKPSEGTNAEDQRLPTANNSDDESPSEASYEGEKTHHFF